MKTPPLCLICAVLLRLAGASHAVEAKPASAFPGAHGNYGGIVQSGDSNFLTAGALVVVLEDTGVFSANLNWQGIHYPFVGKFAADTATFSRKFPDLSEPGSKLVLELTLDAGARTIASTLDVQSGNVTTVSASGELSGAAPDGNAGKAYQGTLNTSFIDPPGYGNTPQDIPGDGFSITRIGKAKIHPMRVIGRMPDTALFSSGSILRGTTYLVFSAMYRNSSGIGGQTFGKIDASDPHALSSVLPWAKRAGASAHYYLAGFNTGVGLLTTGYSKSVEVHAIPHISITPGPVRATLTLTDGNLGKDSNNMDVVLTAQIKIGFLGVKVLGANPQNIAVHANAAGATWAGTFIHPVSGKLTAFHGGFTEAHANMNGEGRGNFKGSVPPNSADLPESGSARITVN